MNFVASVPVKCLLEERGRNSEQTVPLPDCLRFVILLLPSVDILSFLEINTLAPLEHRVTFRNILGTLQTLRCIWNESVWFAESFRSHGTTKYVNSICAMTSIITPWFSAIAVDWGAWEFPFRIVTRRFMIVVVEVCHWTVFLENWVQFSLPRPTSVWSIVVLSPNFTFRSNMASFYWIFLLVWVKC